MVKKVNFLLILLLSIFLTSCTLKENLTFKDFEEIYNFKSKTILIDINSKKVLKDFIHYDYLPQETRNIALSKCNNYIKNKKLDNVKCKIQFVKITNKIESSVE